MYKFQKESDSKNIKTLHWNMLLLFSAIPMTNQAENSFPQSSHGKLKPGKATPKPEVQIQSLNVVRTQNRKNLFQFQGMFHLTDGGLVALKKQSR